MHESRSPLCMSEKGQKLLVKILKRFCPKKGIVMDHFSGKFPLHYHFYTVLYHLFPLKRIQNCLSIVSLASVCFPALTLPWRKYRIRSMTLIPCQLTLNETCHNLVKRFHGRNVQVKNKFKIQKGNGKPSMHHQSVV